MEYSCLILQVEKWNLRVFVVSVIPFHACNFDASIGLK